MGSAMRKHDLSASAERRGKAAAVSVTLLLCLMVLGACCAISAMAATTQGRTYQRDPAHNSSAAARPAQVGQPKNSQGLSGQPKADTDEYVLPQPPLPSTQPLTPPSTTKPAETRGKYSNPYDRRIPLQGDTHKGYAPARRDPFKR